MASIGAIIDPMGQFALVAKYQKALEKGKILGLRLEFTAEGQRAVALIPREGETKESVKADSKKGQWVGLSDAMASSSSKEDTRPFEDEKKYLLGKYEIRLDEEAPSAMRSAATKVAMDAAIAALEFRKRRAFLMSNQEFELAFLRWEAGIPVPRSAEQADALRREREAAKAAIRGNSRSSRRGSGRGGRGRGSFRGETPQEGAAGAA